MKFNESGLIPVIIQDNTTNQVLMLGYMNRQAFEQTLETKIVTFYSRSRQEIWVKGATSGNYLHLQSWSEDCDRDALLLRVSPSGPACHTGAVSCFEGSASPLDTLTQLEGTIDDRFRTPKAGSYIQSLIGQGIHKMAQKVGEEGVELVIEAMRDEPQLFREEAADLLFHYLVLLRAKDVRLGDVLRVLESRVQ